MRHETTRGFRRGYSRFIAIGYEPLCLVFGADVMSFGTWLQTEIDLACIAMIDLAFHAGIDSWALLRYIEDTKEPSIKDLVFIADALAAMQSKKRGLNLSQYEIKHLSNRLIIEGARRL